MSKVPKQYYEDRNQGKGVQYCISNGLQNSWSNAYLVIHMIFTVLPSN